jgi:hypothetical protein
MGHKDINMTLRSAHLSPDRKRAAIETLENRFSAKIPAIIHNTPTFARQEEQAKLTAVR